MFGQSQSWFFCSFLPFILSQPPLQLGVTKKASKKYLFPGKKTESRRRKPFACDHLPLNG